MNQLRMSNIMLSACIGMRFENRNMANVVITNVESA